jgi:peptide/nickel transport system permease protein
MATLEQVVTEPPDPGQGAVRRLAWTSRFPLLAYTLRRVLAGLGTLLVATFLIFACIQVLPGNVAEVVLGRNATPERVARLEEQLHLNDGLVSRYLDYLGGFLSGDFGRSTAALVQGSQVQIRDVVGPALTNSVALALIVLVFFVPLSLLLGYVSGRREGNPVDHVVSTATLAVGALPEFLIGTVLIYVFFTKLGWFPPISSLPDGTSALQNLDALILPVLTLLLVSLAFGARLLRASVVDVLSKEYIAVARLNGFTPARINLRYLFPNALVPSIQILAQQVQYLLGGIVVVESVFNYPGIGAELVRAIAVRDVQEIMIIATILSVAYIVINILADIVCVLLDPRVRTAL